MLRRGQLRPTSGNSEQKIPFIIGWRGPSGSTTCTVTSTCLSNARVRHEATLHCPSPEQPISYLKSLSASPTLRYPGYSTQAAFVKEIGRWLGQLDGEVRSIASWRSLLQEMGCFAPMLANHQAPGMQDHARIQVPGSDDRTSPLRGSPHLTSKLASSPIKPSTSHKTDTAGAVGLASGSASPRSTHDRRANDHGTQEVLESVRFQMSALCRAVDFAHINLRASSKEFGDLLCRVSTRQNVRGSYAEPDDCLGTVACSVPRLSEPRMLVVHLAFEASDQVKTAGRQLYG